MTETNIQICTEIELEHEPVEGFTKLSSKNDANKQVTIIGMSKMTINTILTALRCNSSLILISEKAKPYVNIRSFMNENHAVNEMAYGSQ